MVYAIGTINELQFSMRLTAEVENMMTSVERVITYTKLEEEPGYNIEKKPPSDWPTDGGLKCENMSLRYYAGGPEVLKNITFQVNPREKIGVAGRTGAGKSSIVSALFRMPDPKGEISIDGEAIVELNV